MRKLKYSMQDRQKPFSEFQQVAAVETGEKFRYKSFLKPCLYSTWFTFIEFVFKLVVACSFLVARVIKNTLRKPSGPSRSFSKPRRRRQRQRERHQTKYLIGRTIAVHVPFESLYISLPSSAKQQREMTMFYVFWRTRTTMANLWYLL